MNLPDFLKRHKVTVAPYLGTGAYGPKWDTTTVVVKCFRDDARKLVRSPTGDEVLSEVTLYCGINENVPINSRVTMADGTEYSAVTSKRRDGGGLATFDHLEVSLR